MKYSFDPKELNNWKARITERLAQRYIEEDLTPTLSEEGWDNVLYTPAWFTHGSLDEEGEVFWRLELKFFVANGLFPTPTLRERFEKLTRLLKNVPDGFLVKLRKTGESKRLKDALAEAGLESWHSWQFGKYRFLRSEHDENEQLPIVNGEVEVVEVKCGKGRIAPNQKRSYTKILKNGFLLRLIHVDIVSFNQNRFELKQKILKDGSDLVGL